MGKKGQDIEKYVIEYNGGRDESSIV